MRFFCAFSFLLPRRSLDPLDESRTRCLERLAAVVVSRGPGFCPGHIVQMRAARSLRWLHWSRVMV